MLTRTQLVREIYRQHAFWYDTIAAPMLGSTYQLEAVSSLGLNPGDVVVDVACGTGSNFTLIEQGIGDSGFLIGIDLSSEMLQQAHSRTVAHGWTNVSLINACAEEAQFREKAGAFLFSFAHDVLQSTRALVNLFQSAKQGARVATCGIKLAPWWNFPLNYFVHQIAWQYHTIHDGLSEPWKHLAHFTSNLEVKVRAFETIYVAYGIVEVDGGTEEQNSQKQST